VSTLLSICKCKCEHPPALTSLNLYDGAAPR
jgi:hypothetical protein